VRVALVAGGLIVIVCNVAVAQVVTETPAPFDSAGRMMTITPPLASRIGLTASVWPVDGDYEEARLYASTAGGFVLAVLRRGGTIERHVLSPEAREALRASVSRGMAVAGRPVSEERPEVISEPARSAFVRNQLIIAAVIYGPAAAAFPEKDSQRAGAYLLTTGVTFFGLMAASKNIAVTRAQNHLATDGAFRGTLIARGLAFAFGVDDDNSDAWATSALVGGIGGTLAGFRLGRGYTDSESRAATFGSTTLAGTTAGLLGAFGVFEGDDSADRAAVGGIVAAGLLGYPLGVRYPRRAAYRVTAGDVMTLLPAALIGGALAATPAVDRDDERLVSGLATAGYLTGVLAADRILVRQYDFTESQARIAQLGAVAGGLLGLGVSSLGELDDNALLALVAVGGLAGLALTVAISDPTPANARTGMRAPDIRRDPRIELDPMSVAYALARTRGQHALVRVRF
jgi:hypothetical protein